MRVTRVHHVSVNTGDAPLEDMVAFYRDVLGLDDEPRPDIAGVAGHWHTLGDSQLHLVGTAPSGSPIDPLGDHYCVAVDDLDAAVAELDARGIEYVRAVQGTHGSGDDGSGGGVVQIWLADPAGHTIELQQETRRP